MFGKIAYLGRPISHIMRRRERRGIITKNKTIKTVNTRITYYVPNAVLSSLQILVHLTLQQHYKYHQLHFTDEENEAREVD